MNNIQFSGTVFKPLLRYTPDGKPVFTFSVAQYTGKNKEGGYNDSGWIRVTAFGDLAEQLNTELTEKMRVTVTGSRQTDRVWVGKNEQEHVDFCVIANEVKQGDAFKPEQADDLPF